MISSQASAVVPAANISVARQNRRFWCDPRKLRVSVMRAHHMLSKAGVECTMLVLLGLSSKVAFATPDGAKTRAAELFEQGVRQFSSTEYEAAAKTFLAADDLAPNARALVNGIIAARRAGLYLLVAEAAERALSRSDVDDNGVALAREALNDADGRLTRVDVSCAATPCTITIDGAAVKPGRGYVLPGTHDFIGSTADGATVTEHLTTVAGASYRISLNPTPRVPPSDAAGHPEPERNSHASKPLSPGVFYVGAAGTAVLVGVTIWSGVETLSAKSSATRANWDHVENLALRTDMFLAGAVLLGAATAAAGLWGTQWGNGSYASAAVIPGGAAVVARGRF
jgi:hypothetical protein